MLKGETTNLDVAQARADSLKDQFVMDMHTHFLRDDTPIRGFVAQREAVGKAGWNPTLVGKPQTIDDLKFPNYFKEIFLDSDTKVACISGSYSVDAKFSFLTNDMKRDAREKINKEAGTRRMYSHAIFTPGWPRLAATRSTRRTSGCGPTRGRATRSATTPTSTSRSSRSGWTTRRSCTRSTRSS